MLARVHSSAIFGIDAYMVEVEVFLARGSAIFNVVGLPDPSVKESRDRVTAAIKSSNFQFPFGHITVNLAPADVKKEGAAFDLPIAVGILAASGQVRLEALEEYVLVGELSLDGGVRSVSGVLPIALAAKAAGQPNLIVPAPNVKEAAIVEGLKVFPVESLYECAALLNQEGPKLPFQMNVNEILTSLSAPNYEVDFSEVKGQEHVKRALEVAAAGGHNVIMMGPPGAGKTMLAKRLPTILPPLSLEEALEVTKLYSISGLLPPHTPLVTYRAFRFPHYTASNAGLIGGGSVPKPGEVSLAHHGVLFLDELPEFHRDVLEALRQPLEDGIVTISRAVASLTYPARLMLVAAMNPCPCGYFSDPQKECRCTPYQVHQYRKKVSGPLLDRIDIHVEVPRLRQDELMRPSDGEGSQAIRQRVQKARQVQQNRFQNLGLYCNAQMQPKHIKKFCRLTEEGSQLLGTAISQLGLSARAYDRILKLARTIADLEEKDQIQVQHLAEAIQYRSLDRKFWS